MDPERYLRYEFERIADHPINRVDEFTTAECSIASADEMLRNVSKDVLKAGPWLQIAEFRGGDQGIYGRGTGTTGWILSSRRVGYGGRARERLAAVRCAAGAVACNGSMGSTT
jgi:hypothetical protein